jgi:membrane glycosyltransferase
MSQKQPLQPSPQFSAKLFRSWLAAGLALNLLLGQSELAVGPLWLWLIGMPLLCITALHMAQPKKLLQRWLHSTWPQRRRQATRRISAGISAKHLLEAENSV